MKVLAVSFEYPPYKDGGLARYSHELVSALRKFTDLKLRLLIAMPKSETKPEEDYIDVIELPHCIYYNRLLCYLFFSWKVYFRIFLKKKELFDVFHILNQFSYLFAPLPKSKIILTVHNTLVRVALAPHGNTRLDRLSRRLYYSVVSLWEWYLCNAANNVITVSNSPKEELIKYYRVPSQKIVTIYNGVTNLRFRVPRLETRFSRKNALFVGRLVPRKGIEYLIQAIHLVKQSGKDINLYIIGKGEKGYELKLRRIAQQCNLQKEVNFLGFVQDDKLDHLYSEADIFVLPSLIEGFGLVLLEAMLYGKPVVASDIGGVREVVRGGKDGILVKAKDAVALARAIVQLLEDDLLYRSYAKSALNRVKHFSWEKCANETFQLYND